MKNNINALAMESFERGIFDPVSSEVQAASTKVSKLYNDLKSKNPALAKELFELDEAQSEYLVITAEQEYLKGFKDGFTATKGGQE